METDFSENDLEYAVGRLLAARKLTIACAESCTGGLLSGRLTAVPGSSAYVMGAWCPIRMKSRSAIWE